MRGAKDLDGRRVKIRVSVTTKGGDRFLGGDEGTFKKIGTVRCLFTTDDGRQLSAGHMSRLDFTVIG